MQSLLHNIILLAVDTTLHCIQLIGCMSSEHTNLKYIFRACAAFSYNKKLQTGMLTRIYFMQSNSPVAFCATPENMHVK